MSAAAVGVYHRAKYYARTKALKRLQKGASVDGKIQRKSSVRNVNAHAAGRHTNAMQVTKKDI
jgi:hypothetical protein